MSDAPQSRTEVDPVEAELRRLDDDLRIEWEPKAVMVKRGGYTARGQVVNPVYDGRWVIVKKGDPFRTQSYRPDTRVCFVTQPVEVGSGTTKMTAMREDGPYAPVGDWLVTVMRSWDRHNREAMQRASAILDGLNEKADADALTAGQEGEAEKLDEMFFHGTMRGGVSTLHPVKATVN